MPIIGRIYKIVSSECDGVYIGSTTQQLNVRFYEHKSHYKRYLLGRYNHTTSFEIMKVADAKIELVHEGVFDGRKDLEQFEGDTIRTTPNAVNKNVAGRSRNECNKLYHGANRYAIIKRKRPKCACDVCGGIYTLSGKAQHVKTKKHQHASSSTEPSSSSPDVDTDISDQEFDQ